EVGTALPVGVVSEASPGRDVLKAPAPLAIRHVVVERVWPAEVGDEQVRVAVVVDISDGHPLACPDLPIEPDHRGHVLEPAVTQILEKFAARQLPRRSNVLGEATALHQKKVKEPILVVIDPADAGPERFHHVFVVSAAVEMVKINSGGPGDVDKADI